MVEFLVSTPSWMITALVAGALGALGGAIAWLLRGVLGPRMKRAVPMLFVAIGVVVTNNMLAPSILNSDAGICAQAEQAGQNTNTRQMDTQMDEVTIFRGMAVDCARQTATYSLDVALDRAEINEDGWKEVAFNFNAAQCGHPLWRKLVLRGWTVQNAYAFQSGAGETLVADCFAIVL